MDLKLHSTAFQLLMNVHIDAKANPRCLLLVQMTMVKLDAIRQVAHAFVKQLHQVMAHVVKVVTMVIDYTNTKLMVKYPSHVSYTSSLF